MLLFVAPARSAEPAARNRVCRFIAGFSLALAITQVLTAAESALMLMGGNGPGTPGVAFRDVVSASFFRSDCILALAALAMFFLLRFWPRQDLGYISCRTRDRCVFNRTESCCFESRSPAAIAVADRGSPSGGGCVDRRHGQSAGRHTRQPGRAKYSRDGAALLDDGDRERDGAGRLPASSWRSSI